MCESCGHDGCVHDQAEHIKLGYYDDWTYDEYDWEDEADEFSCDNCGPWCLEWGGDGLCMAAIRQQAADDEDYCDRYVTEGVPCPVCGKELVQYAIPVDELWIWPGDFYNPMVALGIYAFYDAPKGEIHRSNGVCHIWVGDGEYRQEKLIKLGHVTCPDCGASIPPDGACWYCENDPANQES
jgi:hypothetical protein